MSRIITEDLEYTWKLLSEKEREKLRDSTILITGCGGFLGQFHMAFYERYAHELNLKKVIGVDNFMLGKSPLILRLENNPLFDIHSINVLDLGKIDIVGKYHVDYVIHMASIASPTFYRTNPLDTIDSNVWGLRLLLDTFSKETLKGFLFYSSSEIYGDPVGSQVPTNEEYWGNVSCVGPRACYDESKRFGETLCWVYHKLYDMPIRIVRLFNVYGPGLKINDRRAPADFAESIINNRDIVIFSNGQPTRTFCYVADSTIGEIKSLLSSDFDVYNIGSNSKEVTILQFAQIFMDIGTQYFGYSGKIVYKTSNDIEYLVHDPQRRFPDLTKARQKLDYSPSIELTEGITRYLKHLWEEGEGAKW